MKALHSTSPCSPRPLVWNSLTPVPGNAFSDGDIMYNDILTYTANINSQSTWLSFNTPTLTFSGIPINVSDIGISTITVTATDLNGGSTSNTFTVTVGNRIPTVNEGLASTSVFVGDQFSYKIPGNAFIDPDGGTLSYSTDESLGWLSFDTPTLTFSGTPSTVTDIGVTTITVTATDSGNLSVSDSFILSVLNDLNDLILKIKVFLEGAQ